MIFATTTQGKLVCLDLGGQRAWEREWGPGRRQRLTMRVSHEGRPWVGVGGSLIEIDHDGRDSGRIELARDGGERLGSFLLASDSDYACLYRPGVPGTSGPTITKLDPSGST